MSGIITQIHSALSGKKLPLQDEKALQSEIFAILYKTLNVKREYRLDEKNVLDFFIENVGIEVKIKGQKMAIYRQCKRYCDFDEIKSLVLITNRAIGFPRDINGKPCYVINLGIAWL